MIITNVALSNWRNFRSANVRLGNRVFVVGPNASGKSNFLDLFAFLRDLTTAGGGLQKAVNDRGGISKIRCLAARQNPDLEIKVELSEDNDSANKWVYEIGIKQESRGHRQPYLSYEKVTRNGDLLLARPDQNDHGDPLRLTQTHLEQISANAEFRDIAKFFEAVDYQHLVPQLIRHPEAFSGPGMPGDPYGRNFLERVARTPDKIRKSRLRKIESALKIAVPQLSGLTDIKDETGVPHLEAVYQHWRPKGAKQQEDQFSDGTLRLIGLLWSMLESGSLLLLEEPELSLNTGIVKKLPGLMHRVQKQRQRQVMVSTHSPDLLSDPGIAGEEVLLLIPSEEGTSIQSASSVRDVRDLLEGGLTIADAVIPRTTPQAISQLDLFE